MSKNRFKARIMIIITLTALMIIALIMLYRPATGLVDNGEVTLSERDFVRNRTVALDGEWEFYWNRLLTAEDFRSPNTPIMDSTRKVPGSWNNKGEGLLYSDQGYATYRLLIHYPATLNNPAIKIQGVVAAYKVYANGQMLAEVGKVSDKPSGFQRAYKSLIVTLPKDSGRLELIIQVANFSNHRGGLRGRLIFASEQVLNQQGEHVQAMQLLLIGSVLIFGIYYVFLFFLQRRNMSALFFGILCFITALHASLWGEIPLKTLFPEMSLNAGIRLTYFTGYNTLPAVILFIYSFYPQDFKKRLLRWILLPSMVFDALLFTPITILTYFNKYYLFAFAIQILYIIIMIMKPVLRYRSNSILMYLAINVFIITVITDMLGNAGYGPVYINYIAVYGNFIVIMAMSYLQARQQADIHKKLVSFNEQLVEADRLRDKIMATEMSFLQAQIKPHFLNNALNAIANVCEKDGKKAAKLILDMAVYLRRSLEFNQLEKISTIEKELEFVDTYFNIEQARFGQKLQLRKQIEVSFEYPIPVLILQPLVENAVRHGISKKPGGGTVSVIITQIHEGIRIEIKDDGVGIDPAKLAKLLEVSENSKSVGLINIHSRLLRIYGKGLEISSEPGCGTSISLLIPERSLL